MVVEPVGFLPRLIANIVDSVIQVVPIYLIQYFLFRGALGVNMLAPRGGAGQRLQLQPTLNVAPDRLLLILGVFILLELVWFIGYNVCFWSAGGQTPGKMLLGIRVISTDGEIISFWRALLRWFAEIIAAIPFYLGFLWIIWDKDKQGWHDKIAGTVVVRTKHESELQSY